ncbi:hypothetical protein LMG23992_03455 [Cupriavidus laharis]|uniref:Glycosyltransferase n=1 Tax=Cupriavidus laharis TaxID=151654 RepID=A0ABN7YV01_9BURK|nr:glycosyltransferase family 4 protein [Cupriavidus laharis]CAG9177260.1 hypothetical protein LMG23992_03455 [Cupriavidus laharis]
MKPTVMIFVGHYLPGYLAGGPIRTIANMVEQLGREFDFRVITLDRDLGDSAPYVGIKANSWNEMGLAHVYYMAPEMRSLARIGRILQDHKHDIVYLNSFFNPQFTIKILLLRLFRITRRVPLIIAPRGEFSRGAMNIKKWKKLAYIQFAKILGLYRDAIWHASTEIEAGDIAREFGVEASAIHVARNITSISSVLEQNSNFPDLTRNGREGPLKVCFLSRVSPKKNLDYALKVLSKVDIPINFDIFGPREDVAYWTACEKIIAQLPSKINVTYHGGIENSKVRDTIKQYDVFFVPTKGENFGHVFFEALVSGVPVLTSDQTPWRALQQENVGWDIPLDRPEAFVAALKSASSWDTGKRNEVRELCRKLALRKSADADVLAANRQLFTRTMTLDFHGTPK